MINIIVAILTGLVLLSGALHNIPGIGSSMDRFAGWLSTFDVVIGVVVVTSGVVVVVV